MPNAPAGGDTIRVLVATDNHVGYNERDEERGDDSANTFDEIMHLAKERTVDMVLLAGDLFHENNPSRKALNAVMRSLRTNCYGDKPCELEMLSDATEHFDASFDHVNYEDPDINVAIPVFSIHGNHDDPSGAGHLAALDLLQTCGLINYYGRTPESDNINIKPVLLQKGRTKLALYGMSNVRDERLYRTFRDGHVRFFQPRTQKENWFNLLSVHQNHVQHTSTGTDWLPEEFLPDFMDLIVWGHEHECLIDPRWNPERNFKVMQPGSSVATSLMPGEAVEKHVAVMEITGKEFKYETIRLKTVRPFVMKEIVLRNEPGMADLSFKENNKTEITRHLENIINQLISDARQQWHEAQDDDDGHEESAVPKPLIRLRVDYTPPDGGKYDLENPQRFSSRFIDRVANKSDIVQYHKKKTATRNVKSDVELPDESTIAQITIDSVKVEKLVREYLTKQSLTLLPPNSFGDAVAQFVDKDDRYALSTFLEDNLKSQMNNLMDAEGELNEDGMLDRLDQHRSHLEELFKAGHLKQSRKARVKPKPDHWDSDMDGSWEDQPGAIILDEHEHEDKDDDEAGTTKRKTNGAARGQAKASGTAARKGIAASQRAAPKGKASTSRSTGRGGKKVVEDDEDEDEEDEDVVMLDDDEDEEPDEPPPTAKKAAKSSAKGPARRALPAAKKAPTRSAKATPSTAGKQSQLNFSQPATETRQTNGRAAAPRELSDDEISDDDDAFEPTPAVTRTKARR